MNRVALRPALSTFMILLAMVACVLPSQGMPSNPTVDTGAIETAIVSTMRASAEQTAAAQPATTKTPGGIAGAALVQAPDGGTKYTDNDGGFEVTFPVGWLVVLPNTDEFNAVLAREGARNSMLRDQMTYDQAGYNADLDRVYSYALLPDVKKNVLFGFSKLVFDTEDTVPIDSVTMGRFVRDLEASGATPGFRADTAQVREYTSVKMIEIGGHWMMSDGQGGTIPFYATVVFFKPSPNAVVRMTFSFLEDYHEQVAADIRFIVKSVKLLEP